MTIIFVDRESAYPNRYKAIPETGEPYYLVLERADEPVTPGTPLNAETFNAMVASFESHAENKENPHGVTAKQVGAISAIESDEFPGCYYRIVDGETEWINPPMMVNVEYRTMKRWMGHAVYTQAIDLGALPNDALKFYPFYVDRSDRLLNWWGITSDGDLLEAGQIGVTDVSIENFVGVGIQTNTDMSNVTATIVIEYTKF